MKKGFKGPLLGPKLSDEHASLVPVFFLIHTEIDLSLLDLFFLFLACRVYNGSTFSGESHADQANGLRSRRQSIGDFLWHKT